MSTPIYSTTKQKWQTYFIFTLPFFWLFMRAFEETNYNSTYSLDDPYIHLALAENIYKGHYGINPGEFSSPSSSILWPFLLALFYPIKALFTLVPLILNSLLAISTGHLIFSTIPLSDVRKKLVLTLLILFSLNIYGLVFTGMEHSLQVWLTMLITRSLVQKSYNTLFFSALILLPLVRYEGLAISLPVLLYTFFHGKRKASSISLLLLLIPMIGFSYYLHKQSGLWLPSSILAKTTGTGIQDIFQNLKFNLRQHGFLFGMLWAALIIKKNDKWLYSLILLTSCALFFTFGRFGFFGRYEVFYLLFLVMVALAEYLPSREQNWKMALSLPIVFIALLATTFLTPNACGNIYRQQVQMGAIVTALNDKVAVNDLGIVSLTSPHYVLDLWGLGSIEVVKARKKTANPNTIDWINELMEKHHVSYAMVYDSWFPTLPAEWIRVGKLTVTGKVVPLGDPTVTFYATNKTAANKMWRVLTAHKKSMNLSRVDVTLENQNNLTQQPH